MPTALDREGYKYYFYSNEHTPEHVHVKKDDGKAKFDISDGVQLVESKGMKIPELKRAQEIRVSVSLPNGIAFSFPIVGNWRLEEATADQLNNMEVDDEGLHWPDIDEDLSFEGLLNGDYGQYIRRRAHA